MNSGKYFIYPGHRLVSIAPIWSPQKLTLTTDVIVLELVEICIGTAGDFNMEYAETFEIFALSSQGKSKLVFIPQAKENSESPWRY